MLERSPKTRNPFIEKIQKPSEKSIPFSYRAKSGSNISAAMVNKQHAAENTATALLFSQNMR